ncbi:hypothetical protein [Nitrobacter sp.]|uniref:hypothetical protein n=1 Tax=unclassified Nitrobacter TaxID=2620411 RepID=UPI00322042A7
MSTLDDRMTKTPKDAGLRISSVIISGPGNERALTAAGIQGVSDLIAGTSILARPWAGLDRSLRQYRFDLSRDKGQGQSQSRSEKASDGSDVSQQALSLSARRYPFRKVPQFNGPGMRV